VGAGGPPDLFAVVPSGLFKPLGGTLAPLYWRALARFYQYEFEEPTQGLVKSTAVELAETVLRESALWRDARESILAEMAEDEPDGAADDDGIRHAARRLVDRLAAAGWFHFEYQSRIGEVLNFYPYAARIIAPLLGVARDEQPVLQGYAIAVLQALRPDATATRPGWAIMEAKDQMAEFVRELKLLNRNIYDATRRLIAEATSASVVLEDLLTRYQRRVMGSFHRLKTVDNPFRHRGEIFLRLDTLEMDEVALDRAARWYAEEHATDLVSARQVVVQAMTTVRRQLEALPDLVHDIDARNARFSGSARNRLVYLLSRNRHIDGQLQALIDHLIRDEVDAVPVDLYRTRFLREDFLYIVPEKRVPPAPTLLPDAIPSDIPTLRERARRLMEQPFSERMVRRYIEGLLAGRSRVAAAELPLASDEDYVRFICVVMYGCSPAGPYRFRPVECPADACGGATCPVCRRTEGRYRVPAGEIERQRAQRATSATAGRLPAGR
jgi:Family of unknown function (DUF5716)